MELSRFSVTGPLSPNTPLCVIQEIAEAHSVRMEERETFLSSSVTVSSPLQKKDLGLIATFVNRYEQWTSRPLLDACSWLLSFSDGKGLQRVRLPLAYGAQTPREPRKLNACILYRLCIEAHIMVYPSMSMQTMSQVLTYYLQWQVSPSLLLRSLDSFTGSTIANLLLLQREKSLQCSRSYTFEELEAIAVRFQSLIKAVQTVNNEAPLPTLNLMPLDEGQAIYLAAINYYCDLSAAASPLQEYHLLAEAGSISAYQPHDAHLAEWKRRNPLLLDLRETFNPVLPEAYYRNLPLLVNKEGLTKEEIQSASLIELMQMAYLTCTFYEGWQTKVKENHTLLSLEPLDESDPNLLLGFGVKSEGLSMVTYSELIDYFNSVKLFANPAGTREYFDAKAIRKLKDICIKPCSNLEQRRGKYELLKVIELIENEEYEGQQAFKKLNHQYTSYNEQEQHIMQELILLLFHLAMYMRGWKGTGTPYPIAVVPPVDGDEVDVAVAEAFSLFYAKCSSHPQQASDLLSLPLVKYADGYVISKDPDDGLTIGERLNIVKQGDKSKNEAACIRLSSNWIAPSANRAHIALGLEPFFEPSTLRLIG